MENFKFDNFHSGNLHKGVVEMFSFVVQVTRKIKNLLND